MTLRLNGDNSGFTEIKAADNAGDNSIKLPAGNGSANELLKNSGTAGELEFASDVVVDSSNRLLVGASTFVGTGGGAQLQVIQDDGGDTRSLTIGSTSADQQLHLGTFANGTSYVTWGGHYDGGVWNSDDAGDTICPGAIQLGAETTGSYIRFRTTATANSSPLSRIEIKNNGALALLSDCPGIDFSAISSTALAGTVQSNLLDDYEEGTFAPTLYGGVTAGTFTPTGQNGGMYTKIGNIVYCMINVQGTISGAAGQPRVGGLPFTSAAGGTTQAGNATYSTGSLQYWNQSGADFMGPLNQAGTSYIYFHDYDGDSSGSAQINNAVGHNLHCCVAYRVA